MWAFVRDWRREKGSLLFSLCWMGEGGGARKWQWVEWGRDTTAAATSSIFLSSWSSKEEEREWRVPLTNGMIAHCGDIWGTTPIWEMEEWGRGKGGVFLFFLVWESSLACKGGRKEGRSEFLLMQRSNFTHSLLFPLPFLAPFLFSRRH